MVGVYFVHQIKHEKAHDNVAARWDKGIVVKDAEDADNLAAAKHTYHAYLGAYGFGNNANTDYVQCMITNLAGIVLEDCSETWDNLPKDEPQDDEEIPESEPVEVPE